MIDEWSCAAPSRALKLLIIQLSRDIGSLDDLASARAYGAQLARTLLPDDRRVNGTMLPHLIAGLRRQSLSRSGAVATKLKEAAIGIECEATIISTMRTSPCIVIRFPRP